ncbi:hypothetical protein ALC57_13010, partial [Trachymyrmex cornetzi]
TTRAAVAYFRGDAPVKYSRIKRRQRPGVNRDELDEWEPSPGPECIRERKISTGSRLQPECRGVSAARGNPERACGGLQAIPGAEEEQKKQQQQRQHGSNKINGSESRSGNSNGSSSNGRSYRGLR